MILLDPKLMVVGKPEQGTKTHQDPETSQEGSLVLITPAGFGFRVGDFEGCPLAVNHHFVPPEGSLSEAKSVICQMCLPLLRDSTGPIARSKMPLSSYTKRLYNLL